MALSFKNHAEVTRSTSSLERHVHITSKQCCGHLGLPGMLEELDPDLMLELDKEVQS